MEKKLKKLKEDSKKILSCFLTVGYPTIELSELIIDTVCKSGADVIELGVPFSDPIADGPTIQESSTIALEQGITLGKIIEMAQRLKAKNPDTSFVLMSYTNPILAYGVDKVFKDAAKSGIEGVIIPDMIPEEADEIEKYQAEAGVGQIYLVAPNTSQERMRFINSKSQGFVYVVSITGITGKSNGDSHIFEFLDKTKENIDKVRLLGFGIATPEDIHKYKHHVDGVIVGSAIIKEIGRYQGDENAMLENLRLFITSLRTALDDKE